MENFEGTLEVLITDRQEVFLDCAFWRVGVELNRVAEEGDGSQGNDNHGDSSGYKPTSNAALTHVQTLRIGIMFSHCWDNMSTQILESIGLPGGPNG